MARLIVITTPGLAAGYRIGGATVVAAGTPEQAAQSLAELVDERDVGVIGIHAPFWEALDTELKQRLERQVLPVVVDIPAGAEGEQQTRRRRLVEMLRHAIGQRIAFHVEAAP